jgi:hydroxypyruvate isomerase
MNRRNFITRGIAGASAALTPSNLIAGTAFSRSAGQPFKLDYAPHEGMFKNSAGTDFVEQIKFTADRGFRSVEDNGMLGRSTAEQEKIGKTLSQLSMTMGVFVVDGGDNWRISLTAGKQEYKDNFLKTCKQCVDTAKRVNAKWMTVVPGFYENHIPHEIQTSNVIDALRHAAEIFEPHGLVMVLEPLSDTPELFLRHSYQTFMICKAVKSPSCKILFDMFHMQRNEGNIINNIDLCWEEIAYFQIGDNPGRNEPTTGEMNYKNIFKHIYEKGYQGILGMEHGNSKKDKEGEEAVIAAYRLCDNF